LGKSKYKWEHLSIYLNALSPHGLGAKIPQCSAGNIGHWVGRGSALAGARSTVI